MWLCGGDYLLELSVFCLTFKGHICVPTLPAKLVQPAPPREQNEQCCVLEIVRSNDGRNVKGLGEQEVSEQSEFQQQMVLTL